MEGGGSGVGGKKGILMKGLEKGLVSETLKQEREHKRGLDRIVRR